MSASGERDSRILSLRGDHRGLFSTAITVALTAVAIYLHLIGTHIVSLISVMPFAIAFALLAVSRLSTRLQIQLNDADTAIVTLKSLWRTRRWHLQLDGVRARLELAPLRVVGRAVGGPWHGWALMLVGPDTPRLALCATLSPEQSLAFARENLSAQITAHVHRSDDPIVAFAGIL